MRGQLWCPFFYIFLSYGYKIFEVYKQDVKIETVTSKFLNIPSLSSNKVNMISMLNKFGDPHVQLPR